MLICKVKTRRAPLRLVGGDTVEDSASILVGSSFQDLTTAILEIWWQSWAGQGPLLPFTDGERRLRGKMGDDFLTGGVESGQDTAE